VEQAKSQFEIQRMQMEAEIKKQLLQMKFQFDMQLAQLKEQVVNKNLQEVEDRKDNRTKIQASQQSELIDQRKNNTMPKDFETSDQNMMSDFNAMLGE
jgi:transposase